MLYASKKSQEHQFSNNLKLTNTYFVSTEHETRYPNSKVQSVLFGISQQIPTTLILTSNPGALYREKNELRLRVRPPARAVYYVTLMGNWVEEEDLKGGAGVKRVSSHAIVKWKVDARGYMGAAGLKCRFPESSGVEFGPTKLAIKKEIRSNVMDGIIQAENGQFSYYYVVLIQM